MPSVDKSLTTIGQSRTLPRDLKASSINRRVILGAGQAQTDHDRNILAEAKQDQKHPLYIGVAQKIFITDICTQIGTPEDWYSSIED